MKKTLVILAAIAFISTNSFAASTKKEEKIEKKAPEAFVQCSTEVGGITYTTWAGGLFMDEGEAGEKCAAKLATIVDASFSG